MKTRTDSLQHLRMEDVLNKARSEETLSQQEILYILKRRNPEEQEKVFAVARELRQRHFGNRVFLYGFINFSTWCRNDCAFCQYRRSSPSENRYRKEIRDIIHAAQELADSGVHLLDLTMGEDPRHYLGEDGFKPLLDLVTAVKTETGLPVMISWGALPDEVIEHLPEAGADWFACYQETHHRGLFKRLRLCQDYDRRWGAKVTARSRGLLIEEGILSGAGESLEDIAHSVECMATLNADQVRVMNFIPQIETPMGSFPRPPRDREKIIISVLRLVFPDRLIPASLDVYGIGGLREKLDAGANVITSLIPSAPDWRGVADATLGVSEGKRTARAVRPLLTDSGLEPASLEQYLSWIDHAKRRQVHEPVEGKGVAREVGYCWWKAARG
jgi:methylornithine synthase